MSRWDSGSTSLPLGPSATRPARSSSSAGAESDGLNRFVESLTAPEIPLVPPKRQRPGDANRRRPACPQLEVRSDQLHARRHVRQPGDDGDLALLPRCQPEARGRDGQCNAAEPPSSPVETVTPSGRSETLRTVNRAVPCQPRAFAWLSGTEAGSAIASTAAAAPRSSLRAPSTVAALPTSAPLRPRASRSGLACASSAARRRSHCRRRARAADGAEGGPAVGAAARERRQERHARSQEHPASCFRRTPGRPRRRRPDHRRAGSRARGRHRSRSSPARRLAAAEAPRSQLRPGH